MLQNVVTVNRERGVHLLPASLIVQAAQKYNNLSVELVKKGQNISALSVLGILSLGLTCGSKIKIVIKSKEEHTDAIAEKCLREIIDILSEETLFNYSAEV